MHSQNLTSPTLYCSANPDETILPWLKLCTITPDAAKADAWVHPQLLRGPESVVPLLQKLNKQAEKQGRPLLVFVLHDETIPYANSPWLLILRTSMLGSARLLNEWPLPYSWESRQEAFAPALINALPGISFCGLGGEHRKELIQAFEQSADTAAFFIKRQQFWGGNPHNEQIMQEFWSNLMAHPFALTPRGAGNFSMRFYQAMSVGRIPVLLDTDMPLPLPEQIDWQQTIVMEKTPEACIAKIKAIAQAGDTIDWQLRCYNAYHQYLAMSVFLGHQLPPMFSQWHAPKTKWWQLIFGSG